MDHDNQDEAAGGSASRCRRRTAWVLNIAAACGLLGACAGLQPEPGPGADEPGRFVELTRGIVAVGDTQEHESTGMPLLENDGAVDTYVEVAQRPPEQPLFGRRILEWALRHDPDLPFLHLGDVMDLSCQSEARRILAILRQTGQAGAVLPGNHDGLMFGIYGYDIINSLSDPDARKWNLACRRGTRADDRRYKSEREAMNKRDFIALYLSEQARRDPGSAGLAPAGGEDVRVSWRHPDRRAYLSAVEARLLTGRRHADSFLAQRLRLPRAEGATRGVVLVGIDTNQAGALVSTWDTIRGRSPGSVGHVRADQIAAIAAWLREAEAAQDLVVFAGHHNWSSLSLASRALLRTLMSRLDQPLVYLSAHTHRGFWGLHRSADGRPLLELNVSSLSDWPIAYRRISFAWDEAGRRLMVRGELLPSAGPGRAPASDADLLAAWSEQACRRIGPEADSFVKYDRILVERQRQARGSLLQWVAQALAPACEGCDDSLYRHAHAYQNAMLDALLELAAHLGQRAHRLYDVALPGWCGDADFFDCARGLQSQGVGDSGQMRERFRRKAELVDLLGSHLDELQDPQARAYMTCRAVHAAKIDYDLTPDDRRAHRSESVRQAEQFFRVEASVGMR